MVGDNEELERLASKLAETYELEELLEIIDLTPEEIIYILLENGYVAEDIPCNV
jgi:hypothetical protein